MLPRSALLPASLASLGRRRLSAFPSSTTSHTRWLIDAKLGKRRGLDDDRADRSRGSGGHSKSINALTIKSALQEVVTVSPGSGSAFFEVLELADEEVIEVALANNSSNNKDIDKNDGNNTNQEEGEKELVLLAPQVIDLAVTADNDGSNNKVTLQGKFEGDVSVNLVPATTMTTPPSTTSPPSSLAALVQGMPFSTTLSSSAAASVGARVRDWAISSSPTRASSGSSSSCSSSSSSSIIADKLRGEFVSLGAVAVFKQKPLSSSSLVRVTSLVESTNVDIAAAAAVVDAAVSEAAAHGESRSQGEGGETPLIRLHKLLAKDCRLQAFFSSSSSSASCGPSLIRVGSAYVRNLKLQAAATTVAEAGGSSPPPPLVSFEQLHGRLEAVVVSSGNSSGANANPCLISVGAISGSVDIRAQVKEHQEREQQGHEVQDGRLQQHDQPLIRLHFDDLKEGVPSVVRLTVPLTLPIRRRMATSCPLVDITVLAGGATSGDADASGDADVVVTVATLVRRRDGSSTGRIAGGEQRFVLPLSAVALSASSSSSSVANPSPLLEQHQRNSVISGKIGLGAVSTDGTFYSSSSSMERKNSQDQQKTLRIEVTLVGDDDENLLLRHLPLIISVKAVSWVDKVKRSMETQRGKGTTTTSLR